ncbi:MAG: hypothetical protein Q9185_006231 [Variospora sp. 1 TL-2023]
MNTIREIQKLNKLELENGVAPEASWHRDHADSAYIYIGGLPFDLSEGDIVTIFSQFGEPTFVKLVRDKETGKSKGFAFLKYEDQRSTDLAVDNLGGATIMGRVLKVDHTKYQRRDDEEEEDGLQNGVVDGDAASDSEKGVETRPLLKEEKELAALLRDQDEDDPMKEYLIQEKREENSDGTSTERHEIVVHREGTIGAADTVPIAEDQGVQDERLGATPVG